MKGTLNKVMLIGHTGDDVKMHYFDGGGCLGRFPLATNDSYTNKTTGERIENTEWHTIVARNKLAETFERYLKKGDKVYIEGRLKTRKWRDDQGNDRYSTEIQCTDFQFLTPRGDSTPAPKPAQQSNPTQNSAKSDNFAKENEEDDLPF